MSGAPTVNARMRAAVADNHRDWFRRCAEAEGAAVVPVGGAELCLTREAMTFPERGIDPAALVAQLRAHGARGAGCWSLDPDPSLGARLVAHGFGWGWRPHWMGIDLVDAERADADAGADPAPPESRFAIEQPTGPPYARTLPYAPNPDAPEPAGSVRLGVRLREKVIGQVVVNPVGDAAGLYAMGVAERVRRRGIGLALTHAACRLAAQRGCAHAVLNATEQGTPLYARAGFRSLGWGQTWWWSQASPVPTGRQVALAEAIGLGELAALEALAPSGDELGGPLPSGELPLVLTLLCGRPEAGAWILDRHPGLIMRSYPPHQTTLLHLAAEHDALPFAELALARGVDTSARDATFGATALGWARFFGRDALAERLVAAGMSE